MVELVLLTEVLLIYVVLVRLELLVLLFKVPLVFVVEDVLLRPTVTLDIQLSYYDN